MQPRASGTAVRPVVGLSFIQVRLRSAPGPLVGFPERGHPFGLATDGEPAQDEVEGGRAHGLGVVIAEDAAAAGQDVFVQLPGPLVLADRMQAHGEVAGGGQGVGVVVAEDAAAGGQVSSSSCTWALLSSRAIPALSPWRRVRAKAAGCEYLHVDFEDHLRPFYFGACGFAPTNAGLLSLD